MIQTPYHIYRDPEWSDNQHQLRGNFVADFLMPRNAVTAKRQFNLIPLAVERLMGTCAFAVDSLKFQASFERAPQPRYPTYQEVADGILARLIPHVPTCRGRPWPFRVTVIASSAINACAYPGGNIVITDQLMRDIYSVCPSSERSSPAISADVEQLRARVDLSNVRPEDVIAALIGHEMTHICARHSSIALTVSTLVLGIFLGLAIVLHRIARHFDLAREGKWTDREMDPEMRWRRSNFARTSEPLLHFAALGQGASQGVASAPAARGLSNEAFWRYRQIFSLIRTLGQLWRSRKCEFESDKWGMIYSARADFNPLGAIFLQELLGRKKIAANFLDFLFFNRFTEWFSTHPYNAQRIQRLVQEVMSRSTRIQAPAPAAQEIFGSMTAS